MLYWSLFSGSRRAIFPQTSDTLEGRVQFRAFLRQQIQGPGRYEPDLDFSNPGHFILLQNSEGVSQPIYKYYKKYPFGYSG